MIKKIKFKLHNFLMSHGIIYSPKEVVYFNGQTLNVCKGSFSRKNENDDAWLYILSKHNRRILDIGCNIGQSSLLMMIQNRNQIVCVDPNPKALARCAEMLIDNGYISQARFVNAFVGAEKDVPIEFFSTLFDAAGSKFSSFAKTSSSVSNSIFVNQTTVDSICEELDFIPDFIKIDVEGAEIDVLHGIESILKMQKPIMFIEVHSGQDLAIEENTKNILNWAITNDYQAFFCRNHIKLENIEQVKGAGKYHLLLIKNGENYPEYLKEIPEFAPMSIFE
jgi:FkbM family methyltransferase